MELTTTSCLHSCYSTEGEAYDGDTRYAKSESWGHGSRNATRMAPSDTRTVQDKNSADNYHS